MTLDLYYNVLSPPARAVAVLAKLLQLESVNYIEVDVHSGTLKTPEFLAHNPAHTIPTLVDSETGFALFESRAILAYLANKYAPGNPIYPSDPVARAKVDKVLFFDASGFFIALKAVLLSKYRHKIEPSPEAVAELKDKLAVLETILGEQPFLAGHQLTIADLSVGASWLFIEALGLSTGRLAAWYGRIGQQVPVFAQMSAQAVEIFNEKN